MAYTVETISQIWDDKHGSRIEIGTDSDSLDLVELRAYTDDNVNTARITMTEELALLVAHTIIERYGKKE